MQTASLLQKMSTSGCHPLKKRTNLNIPWKRKEELLPVRLFLTSSRHSGKAFSIRISLLCFGSSGIISDMATWQCQGVSSFPLQGHAHVSTEVNIQVHRQQWDPGMSPEDLFQILWLAIPTSLSKHPDWWLATRSRLGRSPWTQSIYKDVYQTQATWFGYSKWDPL